MKARIGSSLAKTALPTLLREVRAGKSFTITSRGEPIADLLPAADESRPERELERGEDTRRYRAALASLPAEQRDVYLLHEESELSLEEIARITGVGAETAKSRLRYAVHKLKAALAATETAP